MDKQKPILGITMGDPAGIGPEIIAKAMAEPHVYDMCRPLVVGDAGVIKQAVHIAGVNVEVRPIIEVEEAKFEYGVMDAINLKHVDANALRYGQI